MKKLTNFIYILFLCTGGSALAQSSYPMPGLHPADVAGLAIDLTPSSANGHPITALPTTHGIQILKSQPVKAVVNSTPLSVAAKEIEQPMVVVQPGKMCVLNASALGNPQTLDLGHRYGLWKKELNEEHTSLTLSFRHFLHLPNSVEIICTGSADEIMKLTVGQIEEDLEHSVSIYLNL
jgi:hypothetical protein